MGLHQSPDGSWRPGNVGPDLRMGTDKRYKDENCMPWCWRNVDFGLAEILVKLIFRIETGDPI